MAVQVNEIYKCNVCGNIVEVVNGGVGELTCCEEPMELVNANTVDASQEKHVPVIECNNNTIVVKVGSTPHPMEEKHYIQWIEIIADGHTHRQHLKPGDEPIATFKLDAKNITARAYCNLHGLWHAVCAAVESKCGCNA